MAINRSVAIHQPNFFPWLGYFDKILRSDVFVLLDNVQFSKGSWTNRVKVLINQVPRWLTAPVSRPQADLKSINDLIFDERREWREKMLRTLKISYRQAPHFEEAIDFLEPLILNPETRLATYNEFAIIRLMVALGLDPSKIIRASNLPHSGSSNELLISLTKAVGGSSYICGTGAAQYQEDSLFHQSGIEIIRQDFRHPTYGQGNTSHVFVQGLSIIDALMNKGINGTRVLLNQCPLRGG